MFAVPEKAIKLNHSLTSDLEIWKMTLKTIGHLSDATSSFVHHFKAMGELKRCSPKTTKLGQTGFLVLCDFTYNLTDNLEKQ